MDIDSITPQDMRFNPPSFDAAEMARKIASEYSLEGEWEPLVVERDQNFRLNAEDGQNYVVKVAGQDEDPDITDFQVQALLHLEQGSPYKYSYPIKRDRLSTNSTNFRQFTCHYPLAVCEPTKPVPPVTRTLIRFSMRNYSAS